MVGRALVGLELTTVDWPFVRAMPMPAVYRLRVGEGGVRISGPGVT
ncbi:MAG TPA: hypothetical protein VJX10_18260 [Pseudonocardiaceae bacterium]|nr:hypothetical protein [Pseudonocardiaceae bacterium]